MAFYMKFQRNGKCQKKLLCSECERDQNALQHINCGFLIDIAFKRIEVLKTKDIYNICISKKFKDSTTKDFFIRKFDVR